MERPVSLMDFYDDRDHERLDRISGLSWRRSKVALSS